MQIDNLKNKTWFFKRFMKDRLDIFKNPKISIFLYKKNFFKYYNFILKIYKIFNIIYSYKNIKNKFLYYMLNWNKFWKERRSPNKFLFAYNVPKRWKRNFKKIFKGIKISDKRKRKKYLKKIIVSKIWKQHIWYNKKKSKYEKKKFKNIFKILINFKKTNIYLTCFQKKKIIWTLSLGKFKIFNKKEKKTIYPIHKIIKYILLWFYYLKKRKDLLIMIKFSLIKPKIFLIYYFLKLLKLSNLPILKVQSLTTNAHHSGIRLPKKRRI